MESPVLDAPSGSVLTPRSFLSSGWATPLSEGTEAVGPPACRCWRSGARGDERDEAAAYSSHR